MNTPYSFFLGDSKVENFKILHYCSDWNEKANTFEVYHLMNSKFDFTIEFEMKNALFKCVALENQPKNKKKS